MRTAALLFFYGCLCAGAFRAFMGWAKRSCARQADEALKPHGNWAIVSDQFDNPGTAWGREDGEWGIRDSRIAYGLELAKGKKWEAEVDEALVIVEYGKVLDAAQAILREGS